MRGVCESMRQLLWSWWNVDRVRVPAATGRLLQLGPGDRLLIGQRLLVIHRRSLLTRPAADHCLESVTVGIEYRLYDDWKHLEHAAPGGDSRPGSTGDEHYRLEILLPSDGQRTVHRLWTGLSNGLSTEEYLEEEIVVLPPAEER